MDVDIPIPLHIVYQPSLFEDRVRTLLLEAGVEGGFASEWADLADEDAPEVAAWLEASGEKDWMTIFSRIVGLDDDEEYAAAVHAQKRP